MRFRPSVPFHIYHLGLRGSCAVVVGPARTERGNAPKPATHGINVANMDRSVRPGDNFYMYANGDWIKRTAIPADRAGIGVFSTLDDTAKRRPRR